jgi:Family of unknown function (DUF6529)
MGASRPLAFVFDLEVSEQLLYVKVIGGSIVFLLAGFQIFLAARFWGVTGMPPLSQPLAAKLHRINGRVAVTLAVLVAVVCIAGPAGPSSPTRVLLHSLFGILVLLILSVKFTILRILRKGKRFLPYIGTSLFLTFGAIWLTSVADFVSAR